MKRRPSLQRGHIGRKHLAAFVFLLIPIVSVRAQQPVEIASLRPEMKLRWQRTSPAPGETEGPVLYQLLFSASGTPGTIAKFDSNPRHLTNSSIVDNGSFVAIGDMTISDDSGFITFAGGQKFPGIGAIPGTGSNGQVLTADGSGGSSWQTLRPALTNAWGLDGNTGTGGTNHLGTNDPQPLELWVNGQRAYRLEPTSGAPNVIGGSSGSAVTVGVSGAVIAGGAYNFVTDIYGTVGGGQGNQAGDGLLTTFNRGWATVGGGTGNVASGLASVVGGGSNNTADGEDSTVAGGSGNSAVSYISFVGGGLNNTASAIGSFVGGGESNTASGDDGGIGVHSDAFVGGGDHNTASGRLSAVVGGIDNNASGIGATVAGGVDNIASGNDSFAAGSNADTNFHSGSFVWGDGTGSSRVTSTADNQFVARASGGVIFYSNSALTAGVQLAPGGGSWSSVSDRNVKDHFASVDTEALLAHVLALPITTWNYKSQDTSIRHIGPMAQDFFAAFKVGEDDKHITGIDEGGVALAAIQGLNQKLEQQISQLQAELRGKDAQLAAQQKQIDQLAVQLAAQIRLTEQSNSELARQQAVEQAKFVSLQAQITKLSEQARNTDEACVEGAKPGIALALAFNSTSK